MATIYGKAAGGNFNGANWSTTSSGGADSVIPTAADDCILEAGSGNFTINSSSACRSLDCVGGTGDYAGTLTHTASTTLTIGDGTAGAGNRALRLSAGMTYVAGGAQTFSFVSTSATAQTLTSAGKTINAHLTFNGTGGSWQLADAWTSGGGSNIWTLTAGTLNTNGQSLIAGSFSTSNSNTRTLTMAASAISLFSTAPLITNVVAGLTISPNAATITFTSSTTASAGGGGTLNYNGASFVYNGGGTFNWQMGASTVQNLTITGGANKTGSCTFLSNPTITGTFTVTGNSAVNRVLVTSTAVGTARTLTAAAVFLTNVDFMDITGVGAATWSGTSLGDCGGNSNITFDAPVTQTNTGATGNWSDVTKWTSRVPLPQDNVVIDTGSGTITADMPRIGKDIDFTGFTGTCNFSTTLFIFGSLTMASGMTFSVTGGNQTFAGRGTHALTMVGKTFNNNTQFVAAPGGTYTLQDALVCAGALVHGTTTTPGGALNTNSFPVTCTTLTSQGAGTTLTMGATTATLTSTSSGNIFVSGSAATLSAASATIVIASASTNARTMNFASRTVGTVTYTVANSPGSLTINGASSTIGTLNVGSGRIVTPLSAATLSITSSFNVSGTNNSYLYLPGVTGNYASAPDSVALDIMGDIDIRVRVAMDDWTPSALTRLVSKRSIGGSQESYELQIATNGVPALVLSTDGSALLSTAPGGSPAVGVADGTILWLRVTWRQSDGQVQFFTANGALTDPLTGDWLQLGTNVTLNAGSSIFNSTSVLGIGASSAGTNGTLAGKVYRTTIYADLSETNKVFDADFTTKPFGANTFTESSANAATVTINGALAQVGDGRVSLISSTPGSQATLSKSTGVVSCDYLSIQDSAATGGAKWYAGANSIDVSNNTGWIFAASNPDNPSANRFFGMFE
jgi:hypothetical protein